MYEQLIQMLSVEQKDEAMRILVLGGAGFIGRHAVAALVKRDHTVVIGSRFASDRLAGDAPAVIRVRLHETVDAATWMPIIGDFDAVLNCVGILRERFRESYDAVHHRSPAALSRACAAANVRYVHVSALGLSAKASSRFIRSKIAGERAIADSGADYTIARPSLLDGTDGFGSQWLRRVAAWPVHFVPADANGRLAALDVDDLGDALAVLCETRNAAGYREADLGGCDELTIAELLATLRCSQFLKATVIRVPSMIVRVAAHVFDLFHLTPLSWGHVELMRSDNRPAINALPSLLGREPKRVGVAARKIRRYDLWMKRSCRT
jgi:uncharacterized protein YbjT (DUF2867 family)